LDTMLRTPIDVLRKIADMEDTIGFYINKQRKAKERELSGLHDEFKDAKNELVYLIDYNNLNKEITELQSNIDNTTNYVNNQIEAIRDILTNNHFVDVRADIARNIKEVHPLMMTDLFEKFSMCDAIELAAFFSCFTNINVADEVKHGSPKCEYTRALQLIEMACERLDHYYNEEVRTNIFSGADYHIQFDLADDIIKWCELSDEKECEQFLVKLQTEKGIFIGEFVKAVLKINALAKEMEKICEICGLSDIQHSLSQIGDLTLKSVCTSQSLYI